ncbi:uncharacterized protein [Atheta coriaria]|uniref:uncharacterized protein n=1 Tax=Dalotia coriaria TaxID=877792 RepID=UPI0031F40C7B
MDKFKQLCNKQEAEPILGQMAPSLTTYDSKATGIGGSNVNFPPPNHPNPFIPPLAHIISAIPFPRFNIPVGSGAPAVAPAPAPVFSSGGAGPIAPFPRLFSRSYVAPSLPANYPGPYNPKNPIVVQPVIIPRADAGTPKPILSSLKNSVDDMLAKMKKNGGRLVPENYLNSDALSNSESQVNQINVNVRFEPTPTPPNLYSFFMPWGGRNWLSAPVPKNLDANGDEVTENPGINEDSDEDTNDKTRDNDNDEDDEDFEEEHRMQNQLKDADKSKFNAHVVDSVKKNLSGKGSRPTHEENEELDAAKYGNGLIVQPKQFMQDSEEDLQTLAK